MGDLSKMCDVVMSEIDKIAEKGLTTSNLETAYKLMDMLKDIKTVEAMEEAGYSEAMDYDNYPTSMARGRGRNARRDAMGRYSREGGSLNYGGGHSYADEQYSKAKMDYRQSRAGKQDVMQSLKEKMNELKMELQEMSKDSDFPEERQTIDKYVSMIDRVNREM